jgi:hypothetical protein
LKSNTVLPVDADEQSTVGLIHRTVSGPSTSGSSSFCPSNTTYPTPPAVATSGIPSPVKSAIVGGPPPWVLPQVPTAHALGGIEPLVSTGARTSTNPAGSLASTRHTISS